MKIVRDEGSLTSSIESAQREALKAFGDQRLLIERYIEEPRHVEFQIFGDQQGNIVHLFERDCSVQRRHQKVIEETPAPNYSDELRQRMAKSAIEAARGVGYFNAGTVEFIVTPQNEYYFLEMNTRLQVEHPVTEQVVGTDLVAAQLRVAAGEPLPWKQEELRQRGHSIECRIYAEDPDNGYLPQTGVVSVYREPSGPGVRVDSGIAAGSEVTIKYDPLLAKLIVTAEDRERCVARLARALSDYVILGTTTNISFLRRVVLHPRFRNGEATTAFLTENESELKRVIPEEVAAVAALLAGKQKRSGATSASGSSPSLASVWSQLGEWGR
jgi:acetyl/propionyl-CoA carboxylase alpha subunit